MKQDKVLPNVVTLMTGESLRMSWWSHPRAQDIFNMLDILSDHPDVLLTKLISGKDTFIHRRSWSDFVAVAISKEKWQMNLLPSEPAKLLDEIESHGFVLRSGPAAKELQKRLLINAKQIHTTSGKHSFMLQSWKLWLDEHPVALNDSVENARVRLEDIVQNSGGSISLLPWNR